VGQVLDSAVNYGTYGLVQTDFSGKKAGDNALRAQNSAREIADKELQDAFTTQQGYFNPYLNAGKDALTQLSGAGGQFNFEADPSYQFRLSEGMKALTNAAAARGMNRSGATIKALGGYNQNMASQEYGNAFNRFNTNRNALFQLAGMGQGAAGSLSGYAGHYKDQVAANRMGYGNAAASNYIAQNNADRQLMGQAIQAGTAYATGGLSAAPSMANNVSAQVMPSNGLSGNYNLGDYGQNSNYSNYRYGGK